MKLLDTTGGNTKLRKSGFDIPIRVAGLSLAPDDILCPSRHNAQCAESCLTYSGRGAFDNVQIARQAKTDFYHFDRPGFIAQLKRELSNFEKLCERTGVVGYVRLNVFSDIAWELSDNGRIPQSFCALQFYDYTKRAIRLGGNRYYKLPSNYQLMFSYSAAPKYAKQVELALKTDVPMAVVFLGPIPDTFLDRPVINGDKSDIVNLQHTGHVVGLKYKPNRIAAVDPASTGLVIDTTVVCTVDGEAYEKPTVISLRELHTGSQTAQILNRLQESLT
jgi:hypothetical protein|tara:strand:+ start:2165 stop:2992 length:828 start_codon:yes stop_codon:yes gene_type:complete